MVDAAATPIVGIAIDNRMLPAFMVKRFGVRNSWHMLGKWGHFVMGLLNEGSNKGFAVKVLNNLFTIYGR
jgi:hypothetical protein